MALYIQKPEIPINFQITDNYNVTCYGIVTRQDTGN